MKKSACALKHCTENFYEFFCARTMAMGFAMSFNSLTSKKAHYCSYMKIYKFTEKKY